MELRRALSKGKGNSQGKSKGKARQSKVRQEHFKASQGRAGQSKVCKLAKQWLQNTL